MGFFSKKIIVVSSSVYNLAGDIETRPNYLKSSIVSSVNTTEPTDFSFENVLKDNYLKGQGIRLKNFYRWSLKNYLPEIGQINSSFSTIKNISSSTLVEEIPNPNNSVISLSSYYIGMADISYWVEQYLYENYPLEVENDNYTYTFDNTTVSVTLSTSAVVEFIPYGFDPSKNYIYMLYTENSVSKIYIYGDNTGNTTLDSFLISSKGDSYFYPFIPFRIKNKFLSDTYMSDIFSLSKKAFRKAFNDKYSKIVDSINDNKDVDKLNYVYVIFGASLNVKDSYGCNYIYRFFDNIMLSQNITNNDTLNSWLSSLDTSNQQNQKVVDWIEAQKDPTNPLYNTTMPSSSLNEQIPEQSIRIYSGDNTVMNYDIRISWNALSRVQGTGFKDPTKKVGSCWIVQNDDLEYSYTIVNGLIFKSYNNKVSHITVYNQLSKNQWVGISIYGLEHKNYIYKGHSVDITAKEALADSDESGFIIPLQYDILKKMPLIKETQFCLCNSYLMFNCYKVYKTKWYQSGFFKIAMIVVAVVIGAVTGGAGTAFFTSAGSLLGLTGTAATIVGAVATLTAAMLIMKGITFVGKQAFGELGGAIFSAIVAAAGSYFISTMDFTSFQTMPFLTSSLSVTNKISSSIMQYETQSVLNKTKEVMENYNIKSQEISELYKENIGYGSINISNPFQGISELTYLNFLNTPDIFIQRTLMMPDDMVSLVLDNVDHFSENQTTLVT